MIFRASHTRLLVLFIANICSCADEFSFLKETSCAAKGQSGTCVAVSDCQYAVDIIKQYGVGSEKSQHFLKSNECGFEGTTPKICCPEEKSLQNRHGLKPEENQISGSENGYYEKPGKENPFLFLLQTCGIQHNPRIFGGVESKLGDFPWLVALEYDEVNSVEPIIACGGTLITQRYVITAAHCVLTTSNLKLSKVRFGEYNIHSVAIAGSITHENFRSPNYYSNDIALIRLADDAPATRYIQPICLPSTGDTGKIYWSAGWGQTETRRQSDVKLKVELPYFDFYQCAAKYRNRNIILDKSHICAGGQTAKDTCRGDSGGPLMRQAEIKGNKRWVIDGVLSLGLFDCGLTKWPGIYVKVYDYLPWILRVSSNRNYSN